MTVVLGTDGFRYEVNDGWAKLPPGMEFNADVEAALCHLCGTRPRLANSSTTRGITPGSGRASRE